MSEEKKEPKKFTSWLGLLGVVALLVFKYKVFLLSFALSFGLYAMRSGWQFALTLLVLLYIHEMGHFIYMKWKGLNPQAPVFIPFVGAYVAMKNMPGDKATHAWSALAGPLLGGLTAVACFYYAVSIQEAYLIKGAYFGVLLNLFQLLPAKPLDGGFIAESVARWLPIPGAFLLAYLGYLMHSWLLVLFAVLGFFQAVRTFKSPLLPVMQEATLGQKSLILLSYLGLLLALLFVLISGYISQRLIIYP